VTRTSRDERRSGTEEGGKEGGKERERGSRDRGERERGRKRDGEGEGAKMDVYNQTHPASGTM
jgi:hypothetical protein